MTDSLQHFWLLHGLFWFAVTRFAAPGVAPRGGDHVVFAALFKRLGVVLLGASLLLWALQLSAGPAPEPRIDLWPSPQRWLGLGIALLLPLSAAAWIFLGAGARRLARASGADERKMKGMTALALIAVVIINLRPFVTG